MACLQHPVRCHGRAVCVVHPRRDRLFDKLRRPPAPSTQSMVSRMPVYQSSSPLFQLPRELRDEIWAYVLTPLHKAKSAHFHIYDEVIDSCTYKADSMTGIYGALGNEGQRCALLRTCHAIYNELVEQIYNGTHFELVLFGDRVRPDFIYYWNDEMPRVQMTVRSRDCNRLGKLSECSLFTRMRHVTIIVQPGALPRVPAYTERVASLLSALDHSKSMRTLSIRFNFATSSNVPKYVAPIVASFLPLARLRPDRRLRLRLEISISNLMQQGVRTVPCRSEVSLGGSFDPKRRPSALEAQSRRRLQYAGRVRQKWLCAGRCDMEPTRRTHTQEIGVPDDVNY